MQKHVTIEGFEVPILFARRKGTRSIRLSMKGDGTIRVSVPYGVPELLAKRFVLQKRDWILEHLKPAIILKDGQHIGKNHVLYVQEGESTRAHTKVTDTEISVTLPEGQEMLGVLGQKTIRKACEKALLAEAERLIPQRLETISKQSGITYNSVVVKKLKSRWGACDNRNNISFNTYLIQLEWELIDYVICHELAHTLHHHHQPSFWELVEKLYPTHKNARKILKMKQTDIIPTNF
jgi:predicted metal-dependent hydrolase